MGSFNSKSSKITGRKKKKRVGDLKTENREGEDYENKAGQAASVPALSGEVTRKGWGITMWQPSVVKSELWSFLWLWGPATCVPWELLSHSLVSLHRGGEAGKAALDKAGRSRKETARL